MRFWNRQAPERKDAGAAGGTNALAPEFAAIRQRFIERLRQDYQVLSQYRTQAAGPEMAALVHRLAGSASMVGFADIGTKAGEIDDAFLDGATDVNGLLLELLAIIERAVSESASRS